MRLAVMFGEPHVDRLLASLTAEQLIEWAAFLELEPHGPVRGDLQAGILASLIVNGFRKKGEKPATPGDFILRFDTEPPKPKPTKQTQAQMKSVLMMMAETFEMRRKILAEDEQWQLPAS